MSTISIRVSDQELGLFKDFARVNNKSISEIIRETVLSRIEDEFDLRVFDEYEKEKAAGKVETRPIEELWKELDL